MNGWDWFGLGFAAGAVTVSAVIVGAMLAGLRKGRKAKPKEPSVREVMDGVPIGPAPAPQPQPEAIPVPPSVRRILGK